MLLCVVRLKRLALAPSDRRTGLPDMKEILMKQFACGGVVPGCAATFTAPDEDGILSQVAEHAKTDHDIAEPPPELVEQVRAKITDA